MAYEQDGDRVRLTLELTPEERRQRAEDVAKIAALPTRWPFADPLETSGYWENNCWSVELETEAAFDQLLMKLGYLHGGAFELSRPMGWRFVEVLNRLLAGSPTYRPYELPTDRNQDFRPQHVRVIVPEHN